MKIRFTRNQTISESSIPDKVNKRKWDRWLYISILIILLASFIKWLLTPVLFDSAQGILLQDQYDVQFTEDVQILEYCINENQFIKVGDTLFSYEKYSEQNQNNQAQIDSVHILLNQNDANVSLIAIEGQIEKRKLFLKALNSRLAFWKSEREEKQKLVYLNVITSNELANVDRSIDDVSYQIATIKAEYQTLLNERNKLINNVTNANQLKKINLQYNQSKKYFISPVEGKVDRIFIPEKQVYYKPDKVFSIIKSNFFVRAYIEMDDLDEFNLEDNVVVALPYGNLKLAGKVNRIYAVSEEKDAVLNQKVISDYKYGIVVEIIPTSTKGWNKLKLSNIPVKIRKGIINF